METTIQEKEIFDKNINYDFSPSQDDTAQQQAIAFPSDARFYYKMREALVRAAEARGIVLR